MGASCGKTGLDGAPGYQRPNAPSADGETCESTPSDAAPVGSTSTAVVGATFYAAPDVRQKSASASAPDSQASRNPAAAAPSPVARQSDSIAADRAYVSRWFDRAGITGLGALLPTNRQLSLDDARDILFKLKYPAEGRGLLARLAADFAASNSNHETCKALLMSVLAAVVDPANSERPWTYSDIATRLRQYEIAKVAVADGDRLYLRSFVDGSYVDRSEFVQGTMSDRRGTPSPLVEGCLYVVVRDEVFALDANLKPAGPPLYRLGDHVPAERWQLVRTGVALGKAAYKLGRHPLDSGKAIFEAIGRPTATIGGLIDGIWRRPASIAFERSLATLATAGAAGLVSRAISARAPGVALRPVQIRLPNVVTQPNGLKALGSTAVTVKVPALSVVQPVVAVGTGTAAAVGALDPKQGGVLHIGGPKSRDPDLGGWVRPIEDPTAWVGKNSGALSQDLANVPEGARTYTPKEIARLEKEEPHAEVAYLQVKFMVRLQGGFVTTLHKWGHEVVVTVECGDKVIHYALPEAYVERLRAWASATYGEHYNPRNAFFRLLK